MKTLPLVILLTLILSGCLSRSDRRTLHELDRIEVMMETHPDSALEALRALPIDSTASPSLRARHALLLSQALDKNFIDLTSDSIIAPAVDHYTLRNDRDRYLMTLFYKGRIEENSGDNNSAISDYIRAEAVAKDLKDHFWLGKIYQRMGIILTGLYSAQEGLEFSRSALKEFDMHRDSSYITSVKYDLFASYISTDQYSTAREVSEELVRDAMHNEDSIQLKASKLLLATACYVLDDFDEAIRIYEEILKTDTALTHRDLYILSDLYTRTGENEKAERIKELAKSLHGDMPLTDEYYYNNGDFENAYRSLKWLADSMNRVIDKIQKQSANSIIRISRQQEIDRKNVELRESSVRIIITIIGSVLIISLIILLFRSKRKAYRLEEQNLLLEIDSYIAKVTSLVEEGKEREEHITDLTAGIIEAGKEREKLLERIATLSNNRFAPLDELLSTYYQYSGQKSEQRRIFDKILTYVSRLGTDGAYLKELEDIFNRNYDNIFVKLRQAPHSFSEEEIRLALYMAGGFSTHAICLLISEKPGVLYNRKSRLKKKIRLYETIPGKQLLKMIE